VRRRLVFFCIILIVLAGCDTELLTPAPTITPSRTVVMIPASPTGVFVIPTPVAEILMTEQLGFTPAAPPLGPDGRSTITPTPAPTQAYFEMSFTMNDGVALFGDFYGANSSAPTAPTVLLIHDDRGSREDWRVFATALQLTGFNVLAVDMRGHGESTGTVNWAAVVEDVKTVWDDMRILPGINDARLSVVGAGVGANVALSMCPAVVNCRMAVLLSPTASEADVTPDLAAYGERPLFIAASTEDRTSAADSQAFDAQATGAHSLIVYPGGSRGVELLTTQPDLTRLMVEFLMNN
jgi:pimeloyl-ACP methyl ester carboxylesterase